MIILFMPPWGHEPKPREENPMPENNKNKRSKLLIYCEGETEKQYLMAIAEALKITSGYCERSTILQEEALRILNDCTELASSLPLSKQE